MCNLGLDGNIGGYNIAHGELLPKNTFEHFERVFDRKLALNML